MRDFGDGFDVGDVAARVADGFDKHRLGAFVDQGSERLRIAIVGKAGLDAELRQRVREQVVGAAIQRAGREDVVADFGDGLDGVGDGRLPRGQRECADTAFQRSNALFQHIRGRVHDAGVDVALHFQIEQIGTVLGVVEGIGHGLVDRYRHRAGGGIGRVAAVHGDGFRLPLRISHREGSGEENR
ncbi:hypothetical protein D3C71_1000400 [compost metagenome]